MSRWICLFFCYIAFASLSIFPPSSNNCAGYFYHYYSIYLIYFEYTIIVIKKIKKINDALEIYAKPVSNLA